MGPRLDIDWDSMPLGETSDSELARKLGCSTCVVRRQRTKRGIKAFASGYQIDWALVPFFRYSDAQIAELYGVPLGTVLHHRLKLGIRRDVKPGANLPLTIRFPAGSSKNGEPPVSWPRTRIISEQLLYFGGPANEDP